MPTAERDTENKMARSPAVHILGIAQDGGVPHIGTSSPARGNPSPRRSAACLGIADPVSGERWLVDATPDIKDQLAMFDKSLSADPEFSLPSPPAGILLTHAHVGHYLGLAWLGREMWNTPALPVYAMPRMAAFISGNLPWSDLVRRENISLRPLQGNVPLALNERVSASRRIFGDGRVPDRRAGTLAPLHSGHRPLGGLGCAGGADRGAGRHGRPCSAGRHLFQRCGTAGAGHEEDSPLERFAPLPQGERQKIRFIHLNHSNPLLDPTAPERRLVEDAGFGIAEEGDVISL